MNDRDAVAWLHRRFGFGLAPSEFAGAVARGPHAEFERLLGMATGTSSADSWDDTQLPYDPKDGAARQYAIGTWLNAMIASTDPLRDRAAWLWHGHFVCALDKVRVARLMVDQIRLFKSAGLGDFARLLKAVTVDPAMLIYLDGGQSTAAAPNENYGREVMELFTLGVGNYTEDDVKAAARALTGYRVHPAMPPLFVAKHHDDHPERYLGVSGVHDVGTVIAAIMQHAAMPTLIAGMFAREFLGTNDPDAVAGLAKVFASSSFNVSALLRATANTGLAGTSAPVVLAPVPWFVVASRVTGAQVPVKQALGELRGAAQVPMLPPNVAGWPGGTAWFATGTVVARANLALAVAAATPVHSAALQAAMNRDLSALADALGLVTPSFSVASAAALNAANNATQRLALALITPEFVVS